MTFGKCDVTPNLRVNSTNPQSLIASVYACLINEFNFVSNIGFTVTFVFSFCYTFVKESANSSQEVVRFHLLEAVFGKVSSLHLVIGQ